MNTYTHTSLTVELHNDEIETMREVVRLAHERLRNAQLIQMSGIPLERQAGLVGPELFRVKTMIEKLGKSVGIDLPYDAKPDNEPETFGATGIFGLAISIEVQK
ncbi:MAG: hypothetical protein ABTS22_22155 [Accumulibacter sp.]|jgi:hypothetical protein|uniref:hypothetical protein n=1 Tax=Accumulibacter sp. TaxID=2053492 RepID=UPI0033161D48